MSDDVRRILTVEDDPEIRHLLDVILDGDGREVISAEDGEGAEEALSSKPLDLIVLDLILPDTDGRTLLTRIRSRKETATVPVIVISARTDPDIRQDCYAAGADVFLEKPFDPNELESQAEIRLERSYHREQEGLTDETTGFLNRAGLSEECAEADSPFGLALVQLDRFATFADEWGWEEAEEAVAEIGDAIRDAVGDDGVLGRLGGGELVIFMPELGHDRAAEIARDALSAIREAPVENPDGETVNFTASIGVIEADPEAELDESIALARRRLFRAREAGRNQVVASEEDEESSSARVLVAEDDEISATILMHRLEKEGLDVQRFDNGQEAYEAALEETPDLVVLDIKMPGMDGFEVLERLRRTPAYESVPIILLTSMGSESDVVRGFELGADDYILKPFSPVELSARVWRLLRRGRSESAL